MFSNPGRGGGRLVGVLILKKGFNYRHGAFDFGHMIFNSKHTWNQKPHARGFQITGSRKKYININIILSHANDIYLG